MRGKTPGSIRGSAHSDEGFLLGLLHAAFKLTFVIGPIEVTLRLRNESIISDLLYLEAAYANPLPGPARPRVSADECPVVYSTVDLNEEVVHEYPHIWKRGHESLSNPCDGTPPGRRSAIINTERAVG